MSAAFRPFVNTFNYLSAHERPIVFFSLLVGFVGPTAVIGVPRVRASYGWKPAERIPVTYPLPDRPREPVTGYDDE
ncbi:n19m, NADH-ubiquinone oxidoreductase 9.5 kDa subunit [Malassezia japonica]|uniref:N19m, NADH-ubiquinone oxidoreductase 9.5 kDa subunit n=1 Tax=Malassezia japonica TaxID=223818 RepID=A0AAF0F028_9BASI|nr:n19m, NADH-ubiquinone oxidoreductase 9.5 kDa subunit [Malassezia japonica]WFD37361.1 n19m, NADH-ubiquinone oxidoreductase 9.5 kDa subunit [Malassezia japonica]